MKKTAKNKTKKSFGKHASVKPVKPAKKIVPKKIVKIVKTVKIIKKTVQKKSVPPKPRVIRVVQEQMTASSLGITKQNSKSVSKQSINKINKNKIIISKKPLLEKSIPQSTQKSIPVIRNISKTKILSKPSLPIKPVVLDTQQQYPIMNNSHELMVGTLHEPAQKTDTIVIILHGLTSSRKYPLISSLSTALARSGYAAYRFDFSGNGDSEGRFEDSTPNKLIQEAGIVLKHFKERYTKVYLLGHSLGGTIAIAVATVGGVNGIITIAPPMHPERIDNILSAEQKEQMQSCGFAILKVRKSVGDVPYALQARFLEEAAALDLPNLATYIKCPALLIHGSLDTFVPIEDTNELFSSISSKDKDVLLIGGGDHMFLKPEHQDVVISGVISWMDKRK